MSKKHKLIVILGPTASGKTELSIKLAKKLSAKGGGEIIDADSRTIYRGMDIGTSKPTKRQQAAVRHHLLNIALPNKIITLAEWQRRAFASIDSIIKKKKTPILVGGTGLYISSIVLNYAIPQRKRAPRYESLIIGIDVPRAELYKRINARVLKMTRAGLEKEVRSLVKKYSWGLPALHGIGYREWRGYFEKKKSKAETVEAIQQATRNFAKRQMTWFRGMERQGIQIQWISAQQEAERLVQNFLRK